jgi:hypothetical protein
VFATLPFTDSPNFGVSFRLKDGVRVAFPWDNSSEIIEFGGGQYQKEISGGSNPLCVAKFEDGVVVGTEETIRQCMTNAAQTAVRAMLQADRRRGQIVAAANLLVIRPILQASISSAPEAPAAIENLKSIPNDVDSVQLRVNVSGGIKLSLTMNAADADAAQKTASIVNDALDFGLQMGLQELYSNIRGDSSVQSAIRAYAERVATRYLGKFQPTVADNAVNIEFDGVEHAFGPVAVALLLPVVQAARDAAHRTQDRNSLKQIALAMFNYHDTYGYFPAQASFDKNGKPLLSWRVQLLPFLDQAALYEQFHLDEPWDSEHNLPLAQQMPDIYRNQAVAGKDTTVFLSFVGKGAFMDGNVGVTIQSFTDGTSNTLMLVEANPEAAVIWTRPADLTFDEANPLNGLGTIRPQGFQAALVDGSVRLIPKDIDPETLRRLILRNDGEPIGEF